MGPRIAFIAAALCSSVALAALMDLAEPFKASERPSDNLEYITGAVGDIEYSRLPSGTAHFQRKQAAADAVEWTPWDVRCGIDAMSDRRYCIVSQAQLQVSFTSGCAAIARVGANNFPGSETLIRIDGAKPISTRLRNGEFDSSKSRQIVAAMKKASNAVTRHSPWPQETGMDRVLWPSGFALAAEYACWALPRLSSR